VDLIEVEVTAQTVERPYEEVQMSQVNLPIKKVQQIPTLFGESDVLKAIQLLPGVQGGTEGTTGLYVRGGSSDQNLILLDGVPVYNASHALGIFSVFNGDAMKSVSLTKGGFPAKYGGRLSSVIDIRMKDGNDQQLRGQGSIGLLTSKLTLEGPLGSDKLTFLISGRRTYIDLIARPIIKSAADEGEEVDPSLYFYDLNGKLNYKINNKHRLYLSAYHGSDVFGFKFSDDDERFEAGTDWGNTITALRWNWLIQDNLFLNTTATYSNYGIDILASSEFTDVDPPESFSAIYNSGIRDFGLKLDFDYTPVNNHQMKFGVQATHHTYKPGAVQFDVFIGESTIDTVVGSTDLHTVELDAYVQDQFTLGNARINAGVHFSSFHGLDDESYNYYSVQPRIGIRYLVGDQRSIKLSYASMRQFINLLTSETLSFPTDLWVPSTSLIRPQDSWQVALGYSQRLGKQLDLSIESYYKKMSNVVAFRQGASFLTGVGSQWENNIVQGDGESYGIEALLEKKVGRLTGWIGYTLSWNFRQFPELNEGRRFPFRYDRRHDFSIVASYRLTDRIDINANWVYATGNAISLPERESLNLFTRSEIITEELNRNAYRMSNYHRADISFSFHKKKKRWERTWVIGAYNAYARPNPFFVRTARDEGREFFEEVSILPLLPYVSYQFKF